MKTSFKKPVLGKQCFFLLIPIFFLFSCNSPNNYPKRNNKIVKFFDSSNLLSEEYQIDSLGKRNGFYKIYYPNQKIKFILNFVNDSLSGEQKQFHENGNLRAIYYYKASIIDSVQKWYYPNGNLKKINNRVNGERFGAQSEYDSSGRLKELYFMSGCDTCMSLLINFDEHGNVSYKKGNLISVSHTNLNLRLNENVKIAYYIVIPPKYTAKAKLKIRRLQVSEELNVPLYSYDTLTSVYLLERSFHVSGKYKIILNAKIENAFSALSDTSIIFVNVKH